MTCVLTIAGSDPSGGAGIQADIKTLAAHGVYAMSAVTALTAQNTVHVTGVLATPPDFLRAQLEAVFEDIRPDAVKIGMVPSAALYTVIAERLRVYRAANVVVDPVMISTSGTRLMPADAQDVLVARLLPLAALVTPNIPEAEVLCGFPIGAPADMARAAQALEARCRCPVLIKGGHGAGTADDLLCRKGALHWFKAPRIDNPNTHGTGCTLSSAIAAQLARGRDLVDAVARAKEYLTGAIGAGLDLGHGRGPLDHLYDLTGRFFER